MQFNQKLKTNSQILATNPLKGWWLCQPFLYISSIPSKCGSVCFSKLKVEFQFFLIFCLSTLALG